MDVILGMQWLHSLGVTEVDWRNLTFQHVGRKVVIRGDPSLTKAWASLRSMMKSWFSPDQGFLIDCRAMERGVELYGVEEVPTISESISTLLAKFGDVFN